jgi:hypothetical protein
MLAVRGVYEEGKIRLLQDVGDIKKARAYVILLPEGESERGKPIATVGKRTIQRLNPIRIKGETLSETVITERYLS